MLCSGTLLVYPLFQNLDKVNAKYEGFDKQVEPVKTDNFNLSDLEIIEIPSYEYISVELPLYSQDYYYGKYINAKVATNEINTIPILFPGDRVEIIGDGYLTFGRSLGYIDPGDGFYYASGVCWTTSTLGMLMDEANKKFVREYGLPLFTFDKYDRFAHNTQYKTYTGSNNQWGYAVTKLPDGKVFDYKFTVNPELSEYKELKNIRLKIEMEGREDHASAYKGQVIKARLFIDFD